MKVAVTFGGGLDLYPSLKFHSTYVECLHHTAMHPIQGLALIFPNTQLMSLFKRPSRLASWINFISIRHFCF